MNLPPPPKDGLPAWVVVALVAVVLIAAGYAGITLMRSPSADSAKKSAVNEPVKAKGGSPFAKHIEIGGIRVTENAKKKLEVQMVVINHSAADLPDLKINIALRVTNAAPGAEPVTEFTVKLPALGGLEARDVKAEASTKLRAYEFPDWQFLRPEFEVLSQ